jgi:thymidylate synthase (FAD)
MEVRLVSQTKIDESYVEKLIKEVSSAEELPFIQNVQTMEGLVAYIARVSSSDQKNPNYAGLIKYCINHGHWSILEMGNASFEIETSRMIAPQILRHRSFNFQEFSQRYQSVDESGIEIYVARRQDKKNRQNSLDDLADNIKQEWEQRQIENWKASFQHYKWALDNNIAKECARAVLPLQAKTRLFMNGTLRSWVHYINLRSDPATQKEHREIAEAIKQHFIINFPIISEAAGWVQG